MLGLRSSSFKKRNSQASPSKADADTLGTASTPPKASATMSPPAAVSQASPVAQEVTTPVKESQKTNGKSPSKTTSKVGTPEHTATFERLTIVKRAIPVVHNTIRERMGVHAFESDFTVTSYESFCNFVDNERLRRMPHKGSRWDKVLKWAEHFASLLSVYQECVGGFVLQSDESAQMVWGYCQLLLQMGPSQVIALERALGLFYKVGLTLSTFLRNRNLFSVSAEIRETLAYAYVDLLLLVTDVTIYYKKGSKDALANAVTSNFDVLFGKTMDKFLERKNQIINTMWIYRLKESTEIQDETTTTETIRDWLAPQDQLIRTLTSDRLGTRGVRDEFTCEWFHHHLLEFTRSQSCVLGVNGRAGCGKSVLFGWITERLQRPVGRKSFETISHKFEADIPAAASSLSLIKDLVLQVFELEVGNISFYKSLITVLGMSTHSKASEVESALWATLETGLSRSENTMIIIDGLDLLSGGERAISALVERLCDISSRNSKVKTLVLSQIFAKQHRDIVRHFTIEPSHVHHDISQMVKRSLRTYHHFHDQSDANKESIVKRIADTAQGSFVWADLMLKILKREKTHEGFMKALEKAPASLHDTIQILVSTLDLKKKETKLILSWLLVAERPLTLIEVHDLLQIDTNRTTHFNKSKDIEEDVRNALGSLVVIRDNVIRFRHVTIKKYLQELSAKGSTMIHLQDAQQDLVIRTLTYVKIYLTEYREPSFEPLKSHTIAELFHRHALLEYTIRYWMTHFRKSPMHRQDDSFDLHAHFKSAFPGSTLLALIEGTCWEMQTLMTEVIDMHLLALTIRRSVLGEKHECVLQSQIIIARSYQKLSMTIEASKYYYQAVQLSQILFGKHNDLAITCATVYLTCTSTIKSTTRNESTIHREDILKFLISSQKNKYGTANETTIKYNKILAQLYIDIRETHLAATIYREIYRASVQLYGLFSEQATSGSKDFTTTLLQTSSGREETIQHIREVYEQAERTMRVIDHRRITATMHMAETYESLKDIEHAEEIYITLWRKVVELSQTERSKECYQRMIEVTLYYVKFLRRQHRQAEAESILRGLWTEFSHMEIDSESINIQLKGIGWEMKDLGMTEIAHSLFSYVWSYFKRNNKKNHPEAASTAVSMIETVPDSHIHGTTEEYESMLTEILETSITITTTITATTVNACETLATYFERQKRWSEASKVCQRLLDRLWPSLLKKDGNITLPEGLTTEAVHSAKRLAHYCFLQGQMEEAEKIYVHIFRATKSKRRIDDKIVSEASKDLITFYESTNQIDQAIESYKSLVEDYRKHLGSTHALTIRTLYSLADFCIKHKHKDADMYYSQIVTSLNKSSEICHRDAMEAALTLSRLYYEKKRWTEAQKIYETLWRTFIKRGKDYGMTSELVSTIYDRYIYILEKEAKVSYSVLRQVAIEYKETCVKVFGARAEITLRALFSLAQINEKSEQHRHEAIATYEEAIRETQTTAQTTSISTKILHMLTGSKQRLSHLYRAQASISPENAEKAVMMSSEYYDAIKTQHGCSHETTLTNLQELIILYQKQNSEKYRAAAIRTLQGCTVEILLKEKNPKKLFESGRTIGAIYTLCQYTQQGWELLAELRRQIIARDHRFADKYGFRIEQSDHLSYAFLVSFEETLKGSKTTSFSEVMAGILTEAFLYEHFYQSVKQKRNFEVVIFHGAQLRSYLVSQKRQDQAKIIEDEIFELFQKHVGTLIKTSQATVRLFYTLVLEELGDNRPDVHLKTAACAAGNKRVLALLEQNKLNEAFELAGCVYQFVTHYGGYHDIHSIGYGFDLALYMAGRTTKARPDEKMMQLSRTVLSEILHACKDLKVDFAMMEVMKLNSLASLMGEQKNYEDLEWLLEQLWNSRHSQVSWSSDTIISIGRRLVEVRFSHTNRRDVAIHLCEDICYNLRRVYGPLEKITIEMTNLLSQLYTTVGRYRDALSTHEEVLSQYVSGEHDAIEAKEAPQIALEHFEKLKGSYQRNGGFGDKDAQSIKDLHGKLLETFGDEKTWHSTQSVEKWNVKDNKSGAAADHVNMFVAPTSWDFMDPAQLKRQQLGFSKRMSYNWAVDKSWMNGKSHGNANITV